MPREHPAPFPQPHCTVRGRRPRLVAPDPGSPPPPPHAGAHPVLLLPAADLRAPPPSPPPAVASAAATSAWRRAQHEAPLLPPDGVVVLPTLELPQVDSVPTSPRGGAGPETASTADDTSSRW
eukprot:gene46489-18302_t